MKNLKVSVGKDFGFTVDSASLVKAVSRAELVTSKLSSSTEFEKKHLIFAYKERVFVVGYSSDTFIVFHVQGAKADDDGAFGYDPKLLVGVIKNRKEMTFTFEKGHLCFAALKGKYNGSIETLEIGEDQLPFLDRSMLDKSEDHKPLSSEMLASVREGINIVDLKDHYNKEKIICGIRLNAGVLDISAYDNYHMAYYRTEVGFTDSFTLALPVETFKLIDKFISEEENPSSRFHMTNKELRITSSSFIIVLPPIQVDENYFDAVPEYVKSLTEPVAEVPFTQSAMRTADNMFTLATDETRLSLKIQDTGRVDLSLITEQGKISDAFMFRDLTCTIPSLTAFIDPRIFDDLFKKVASKEVIKVRFFRRRNKGVSACFMISASTKKVRSYLIGTYHEEVEK
jgi:hypothetical protein